MFYGWRIVGVTFVTHFISVGFLFYSYGAFFKALADEFGGGRLGVATGLAIINCVNASLAPLLGRIFDRGYIRAAMCTGALCMALGFLLVSQIEALWQLYVLLALLVGSGSAMLGGLAGSTLVASWFTARRGTALGVATMGISLSGVVMAPAATWLIARLGWRATFQLYAVLAVAIVLPLVWWVVVNRPEDIGLLPDGARADTDVETNLERPAAPPVVPLAPGDQITDHAPGLAWSAIGVLRESRFWAIAGTVAFNLTASGAILTHIIPHATDIGVPSMYAAGVLSSLAIMGVAGKLLFGWLVDRVSKRGALWLATAFQASGVTLLLSADSLGPLLVAATVFGLGMGGVVPLWGTLVGAAFGRAQFGRVMGMMSPAMLPIQLIGIPLTGYIFDTRGSYELAFHLHLVSYAIAALALGMLVLPDHEPGTEPNTDPRLTASG